MTPSKTPTNEELADWLEKEAKVYERDVSPGGAAKARLAAQRLRAGEKLREAANGLRRACLTAREIAHSVEICHSMEAAIDEYDAALPEAGDG